MKMEELFNRVKEWPGQAKAVLVILVLIGLLFLLGTILAPCAKADAQVDLNWNAPTVNCDGSSLTDLAGYFVKWGFNPGDYTVELDVGNLTSTTVDLIGDVEGRTVYFAVVSYDTKGNRSDDPGGCGYSNEIAVPFPVTFPAPPQMLQAGP